MDSSNRIRHGIDSYTEILNVIFSYLIAVFIPKKSGYFEVGWAAMTALLDSIMYIYAPLCVKKEYYIVDCMNGKIWQLVKNRRLTPDRKWAVDNQLHRNRCQLISYFQ